MKPKKFKFKEEEHAPPADMPSAPWIGLDPLPILKSEMKELAKEGEKK